MHQLTFFCFLCWSVSTGNSNFHDFSRANVHPMLQSTERCYYDWLDFWSAPRMRTHTLNRSIAAPLTLNGMGSSLQYGAGPARPESPHRISRRQLGGAMSTSAVYRDVNVQRPASYWDYDNFSIKYSDSSRYKIIEKVGGGKFSKTFLALDSEIHRFVIVKKLNELMHPAKIRREVKVLQALHGGTNIIKLLDVTENKKTGKVALIFEYVQNINWRKAFPMFTLNDVRFYVFEVLKALHYAHSNGVMHRDLKPSNIVMDYRRKQVRVIDWGQSEFYHPNKEYRVLVSTRQFKGPELLIGITDYDYSLDIWSLGCLFAGMLFHHEKFFFGSDNSEQLREVVYVLGTRGLDDYLKKYGIELSDRKRRKVGVHERKPWRKFKNEDNSHLFNQDALALLDKMLVYDHQHRVTAKDAMEHRFFDCLRNEIIQETTANSM